MLTTSHLAHIQDRFDREMTTRATMEMVPSNIEQKGEAEMER